MIGNKKIVVVLPAYNAEQTLEKTYREIPFDIVDGVVLVDDSSTDRTYDLAKKINIDRVVSFDRNKGYGGNQKTCYYEALGMDADIIVMLHPDYQYTPALIPSACYLIFNDLYDVVLGSRILGKGALKGGMPVYKYIFNRILTLGQNILMGQKLSEYHTGFRAYSAGVLRSIDFSENSDDFVFDNELISQILFSGYRVGEISCPTRYDSESSSIDLQRSIIYGFGVLRTSFSYFFARTLRIKTKLFK